MFFSEKDPHLNAVEGVWRGPSVLITHAKIQFQLQAFVKEGKNFCNTFIQTFLDNS